MKKFFSILMTLFFCFAWTQEYYFDTSYEVELTPNKEKNKSRNFYFINSKETHQILKIFSKEGIRLWDYKNKLYFDLKLVSGNEEKVVLTSKNEMSGSSDKRPLKISIEKLSENQLMVTDFRKNGKKPNLILKLELEKAENQDIQLFGLDRSYEDIQQIISEIHYFLKGESVYVKSLEVDYCNGYGYKLVVTKVQKEDVLIKF